MTLEQQQALAMASARLRLQQSPQDSAPTEKGYLEGRVDAFKNAASQAISPDFWKGIGHELTNFPPVTPETLKQVRDTAEASAVSTLPTTRMPQFERSVVIDPLIKGVKKVGGAIRDTADLFLPGGAERIANRYTDKTLVGTGRDKIIDALKTVPDLIPGSKPTAAEAVAHLPEGSPIASHQKIIAATPPEISTQFGQRALDQKQAIQDAILQRKSVTAPMRESALKMANQNGVQSNAVVKNIEIMQDIPGQRASDVVQKTLNSVKEKINSLTNENGVIDAKDLYTVRKEVGNIIKTHAKETSNWDKKLAAGLQKDVQTHIDDAIESAGGTGWKDYLAEFSKRSQAIKDEIARIKASGKPIQKVNLQGGVNVAEETRAHVPQLLSRPAMIVNAALRYGGMGVEPKIDKIMAERYLNPQGFARILEKTAPSQRNAVIQAIMNSRNNIVPRSIIAQQEQQ